jgi:diphosphomevalonate decarboxylase
MTGAAEARTNIALVKYWGKRDAALNLPAAGSLSLTLDGLVTRTRVTLDPMLTGDVLVLGGAVQAGEPRARVTRFLDLVRALAGTPVFARVESENSFPTASGLASSASGFAALAAAAARAYGVELAPAGLSALARRGSGSAARSVFGGFVEMRAGGRHEDAHAEPLLGPSEWDVRLVVAVVGGGREKDVGSTDGMQRTQRTSPLYAGWLGSVPADLEAARAAIRARDLEALGEVAERSALTMHASAMAARPGVLYFRGATVEAIQALRRIRGEGVGAWATVDAGPHVKALCAPEAEGRVAAALAAVPGVTSTIPCRPGAGVEVAP